MIEPAGAFAGQHVLMTGATGGIGSIIAVRLAREACRITAVGRSEDRLVDIKEYIESSGGTCLTIVRDLSNTACDMSFIEESERKFGPINSAFLMAGDFTLSPFPDLSHEDLSRSIATNLISPIRFSHALLNTMSSRGTGKITIVSSLAGAVPVPYLSVYSAAKAGLLMFCRSARPEFLECGIDLCCVAPGAVDTAFIARMRSAYSKFGWKIDSPHSVAEEILRATALGKPMLFTGGFERFGAKIAPIFPNLIDRIMAKPRAEFVKIFQETKL